MYRTIQAKPCLWKRNMGLIQARKKIGTESKYHRKEPGVIRIDKIKSRFRHRESGELFRPTAARMVGTFEKNASQNSSQEGTRSPKINLVEHCKKGRREHSKERQIQRHKEKILTDALNHQTVLPLQK